MYCSPLSCIAHISTSVSTKLSLNSLVTSKDNPKCTGTNNRGLIFSQKISAPSEYVSPSIGFNGQNAISISRFFTDSRAFKYEVFAILYANLFFLRSLLPNSDSQYHKLISPA